MPQSPWTYAQRSRTELRTPAISRNRAVLGIGVVYRWTPRVTDYPAVYGLTGLRPTVLELWVDNGHVTLVVHLGVCCAGVWVACTRARALYVARRAGAFTCSSSDTSFWLPSYAASTSSSLSSGEVSLSAPFFAAFLPALARLRATALAHRPGRLATIFAGDAPSSTVLAGMASLRGVVNTSASPDNGSAAFDSRVSLLLARPNQAFLRVQFLRWLALSGSC